MGRVYGSPGMRVGCGPKVARFRWGTRRVTLPDAPSATPGRIGRHGGEPAEQAPRRPGTDLRCPSVGPNSAKYGDVRPIWVRPGQLPASRAGRSGAQGSSGVWRSPITRVLHRRRDTEFERYPATGRDRIGRARRQASDEEVRRFGRAGSGGCRRRHRGRDCSTGSVRACLAPSNGGVAAASPGRTTDAGGSPLTGSAQTNSAGMSSQPLARCGRLRDHGAVSRPEPANRRVVTDRRRPGAVPILRSFAGARRDVQRSPTGAQPAVGARA